MLIIFLSYGIREPFTCKISAKQLDWGDSLQLPHLIFCIFMWLYEEKHCCLWRTFFKTFVCFHVFLSVFIVEIFKTCLQCTVYFLAVWNCQNKANRTFSLGPLLLWAWSILDLVTEPFNAGPFVADLSSPDLYFRTFCRCTVFFTWNNQGQSSFSFGPRILLKIYLKPYQTANPRLTLNASSLLTKRLNFKGQCHEIFDFRFFVNQLIPNPGYTIRVF